MSDQPVTSSKKMPDRITVTIDGKSRDILMAFSLLGQLSKLVGGPERVPELSFNPDVASEAIYIMLAPRDKFGRIKEPAPEDPPVVPPDLDMETAERLLDWAGAHLLDFFIRQFAKNTHLFATRAEPLAAVGSSLTSSGS